MLICYLKLRVKVFSLGWTAESVLKPLLEEGLREDDYLLIFHAKPLDSVAEKRLKEALGSIIKVADMARIPQDNLQIIEIDTLQEYCELVKNIIREIKQYNVPNVESVVAHLSGGMRILVVALLHALSLLRQVWNRRTPFKVFIWNEDMSKIHEVDLTSIGFPLENLSKSRRELLLQLRWKGKATYKDLAVNKKESTVKRLLLEMAHQGLVTIEHYEEMKKNVIKLTKTGEIIAEALA